MDRLNQEGAAARMIHYSELFPFNARHVPIEELKQSKIIAVENNYTGQFADLFSQATGLPVDQRILRYDGRPFRPRDISDPIKANK